LWSRGVVCRKGLFVGSGVCRGCEQTARRVASKTGFGCHDDITRAILNTSSPDLEAQNVRYQVWASAIKKASRKSTTKARMVLVMMLTGRMDLILM